MKSDYKVAGNLKGEREHFCDKFQRICGFHYQDLLSWEKFVKLMYRPTDPSSLGITRLLFGLLMVSDIPEERGGSELDIKWGDTRDCHFPLFNFLKPLPLPYMGLLYGVMWLGAVGIAVGYKFRASMFAFTVPYWYLFLLDKSYWNNHSYLFGIVSMLLMGSSAHHYCSIDGVRRPIVRDRHVPLWNYFILKYQFFMLYFLAGLKKSDTEWLEGYAMTSLGTHWIFDPFKVILSTEQIDFLVVHWFGFIFDLTVGFWLVCDLTRPYAMLFCASFHIMNSRLFSIGMFPYVCLATMPLFCDVNWPRKLISFVTRTEASQPGTSAACIYDKPGGNQPSDLPMHPTWKHRLVVGLVLTHCGLQVFLPYSHFITKGYNNWVPGLYGYSWDMMVHNWDTVLVVVRVVDNESGREYFLEPGAWTQNDRWSKHADMCVQYAHCLKHNIMLDLEQEIKTGIQIGKSKEEIKLKHITSENISIYIDVWCSLNRRFQQRMFDPNYDLLKARWSPFNEVEWLMPLLTQYSGLRNKMETIQREVYSWSNYSDVLFVADFPGLTLENYITADMGNVTLTVLEGAVLYEMEDARRQQSLAVRLGRGESARVLPAAFHRVHVAAGGGPACYMYTYWNRTREAAAATTDSESEASVERAPRSPVPLFEDVGTRLDRIQTTTGLVANSVLHVLYGVPMVRRARLY